MERLIRMLEEWLIGYCRTSHGLHRAVHNGLLIPTCMAGRKDESGVNVNILDCVTSVKMHTRYMRSE